MKNELKMILKSGRELRLTAEYKDIMKEDSFRTDWDEEISKGYKPYEEGILEAYVDGKLIGTSELRGSSSYIWRLIDLTDEQVKKTGCTKGIWALSIALDEENAEKYEAWKNSVIENGTDEDVREYHRRKAEIEKENAIVRYKKYIGQAESYLKNHEKLMTEAEYREWRKDYNDAVNEGGEGYIPELPTQEYYDRAKEELEKLQVK